jgi:hypothetical protein
MTNEAGLEFEQLTKTAQNVTCGKVSNADERQAALEDLLPMRSYTVDAFHEHQQVQLEAAMFLAEHIETICAALSSPRVEDDTLSDECIAQCRRMLKEHLGIEAAFFDDCIALAIGRVVRAEQLPRVEVIKGLDEALKKFSFDMPDISDYQTAGEYLDDEARYRYASARVEKAARAYAKLMNTKEELKSPTNFSSHPKMQKVDLEDMRPKRTEDIGLIYIDIYNHIIDDIKSKYGELYMEVK